MKDESTYGFSKPDAEALTELIGLRDEVTPGKRPVRGRAGGGSTLFVGELKEAWSGGIAECDIYSMDGVTLTDTTIDADVYDPLGAFSVLTTGDQLYITYQGGKYYAGNNAPCPA